MGVEKILDTRPLRTIRTAAATIRAIMFLGTIAVTTFGLLLLALRNLEVNPRLAAILAAAVGLILAMSAYAWHYVVNVYDPAFYEILELKGRLIAARADGHHKYEYVREQKVKATRNDLRVIEFRAHWTGRSGNYPTVASAFDGHAILDGHQAEEDGRVHRWIYPRRALSRGQMLDVGIAQIHDDDLG